MTVKRVSRGVGLGLEIPANFFYGDARVTTWVKNGLEKLEMCQIKTCICFLFSQPIIGFPLLRGKFCPKCSCGTQKSVLYNKCPL